MIAVNFEANCTKKMFISCFYNSNYIFKYLLTIILFSRFGGGCQNRTPLPFCQRNRLGTPLVYNERNFLFFKRLYIVL